jgi:hypothetical protein
VLKRFARALVTTAGGLVLLITVGTQAAASARLECATPVSRTLLATESARVFLKAGNVYGCLYRTNRPLLLNEDARKCNDACGGVRRISLAGRFVAWERVVTSRSVAATSVVRTDLRVRRSSTVWSSGGVDEGSDSQVKALASTRAGDIAWVSSFFASGTGQPVSYHLHVSVNGGDTELDASHGLDPASLAIGGNRVYWVTDGDTRSHALR